MERVKKSTSADATPENIQRLIAELEGQMITASMQLEFERAAQLRDQILETREYLAILEEQPKPQTSRKPAPRKTPAAARHTRGPSKPNPDAVAALAHRFVWWLSNRAAKPGKR